jgi:hypothetical protein
MEPVAKLRPPEFCNWLHGVIIITGCFAIATKAKVASAAGGLGFCHAAKTASIYLSGSVIGTVTIILHSAGEEAGRWDQSEKRQ